jgi:hypothetical protein
MSVSSRTHKKKLRAANDNLPEKHSVVMNFPDTPPVSVVEVEVFDRLILNLRVLTANDNEQPSQDG